MGKKATGYKIDIKDAPKKLSLEHLSFGSFFPAPSKGYKHYTKKFADDVKLWIINELKLHPDRTKDVMYRIISLGNSEEGTKYDRDFVDIVRGVWDSFTNEPIDKDRYTGSWLWKENGKFESNPNRDWNALFSFGNVKGLYQPIAKDSIRGINNNAKYPTYYGNFVPKKSYTVTEEYSPILLYLADKNLGGLALDEETNEGIVLLPFSDEEYNLAAKEGYTVDNVGRFNVNIGRDTKGNPEVLFYDLGDFGPLYADTYGEDKDKIAFQGLLLNTFGNPFILRQYVPINIISLEQFESMPDDLKWQVDDMNGALLDIAKSNRVALYNPITRLYESGLPEVTVTPKKHEDGGNLDKPLDWNKLSMKKKAAYIKMCVANGYKDIDSIIKVYNEYKNNSHSYKDGGSKSTYTPSDNIKKQISSWEGAAMHEKTIDPLSGKLANKNRAFELEAEAFIKALPSSIRDKVLSNLELADHLFSYSYNVGAGNFRRRVVPELLNYYNGTGNIDNITDSMWASGDAKLKGLRTRRAIEKEGVRNALNNLLYPIVELTDALRVDNPYNNTMLDTGVYTEPQKIEKRDITPRSSRQYILYNALDILDLMGTLMPTYTPIKTDLTTATDLLKLQYLDTLLDKGLEDTIYNKVFGDKHSKVGNIFEGTTTPTLLMNNPMSNPNVFRRPDGTYFYHNYDTDEDTDIFPLNTTFDDPAYWTFEDKSGNIYNPRLTPSIDLGTIVQGEEPSTLLELIQKSNKYYDDPILGSLARWNVSWNNNTNAVKGLWNSPFVMANPWILGAKTISNLADEQHGIPKTIRLYKNSDGSDRAQYAWLTSLLGDLAEATMLLPAINEGYKTFNLFRNEYMFVPRPNTYTRGIGITDAGLQDAVNTGVFRGNPRGTEVTAKQFTKLFERNRDNFRDIMDATGIEGIASKFQSRTLSETEFNAIKEAAKKYKMKRLSFDNGNISPVELSADPLYEYPDYASYMKSVNETIANVEKMPSRIASGEIKVNTELTPTVDGVPHGRPIEERFGPNSDYVGDGQPLSYWYDDGRNPLTRGHSYAKSNYGVRVNNPEDYTPFMHELHLHPSFFKTPQLADPNVEIFGKGPLGLTIKLDKETLQPVWKRDLSNMFRRGETIKTPQITAENAITSIPTQITSENAVSLTDAQWDAAYMKAFNEGNMVEAQRLRNLHGHSKGYNIEAAHGSKTSDNSFTVFNTEPKIKGTNKPINEYTPYENMTAGAFFGDNSNGAINEFAKDGPIRNFLLNIEKPLLFDAKGFRYNELPSPNTSWEELENQVLELKNKGFSEQEINQWLDGMLKNSTDEYALKAYNSDSYDGAIIRNVYEGHQNPNYMPDAKSTTDFIITKPNQAKLTDAVTRDDAGNIIPLSQRDNSSNPDIRYEFDPFGLFRHKKSLTKEDIVKGLQEAKDYKESEGYRNLVESFIKETTEPDIPAEIFYSSRHSEVPTIVLEKRPKGSLGSYKYSTNTVSVDPAQAESHTPIHEGFHWLRVGEVPNVKMNNNDYRMWASNTSKEKDALFGDLINSGQLDKLDAQEAAIKNLYKQKIEAVLKPNAMQDSELVKSYELTSHSASAGKDLGLKPFQEYPGEEKAREIIKKALKLDHHLKDIKDETEENVKNFWKLLTGNYIPIAALGITTSGAVLSNSKE